MDMHPTAIPVRRSMRLASAFALALLTLALSAAASAQPLGSAFTYQGQLTESGQPASGLYDLQVCLYDSPSNPLQIACAPDFGDVPVDGGVFTVALDFGATPFVGQQRYLELRVRPGASSGAYTVLAPRQLLRPAPEALRSNVTSAAPWSGLTGVPAGFADGVDDVGGAGGVTSITAGTGLFGGTITGSGTIGIANGGVGFAQIANNAVGSQQIFDGSIAAVDVAPNSLGSAQIAAAAIGFSELATGAVDTPAVQNAAITRSKIAPGAVGLAQIDTAQVQARIAGDCGLGGYLRGVAEDGSIVCADIPGVTTTTEVAEVVNVRFGNIAVVADGSRPVIAFSDGVSANFKVAKCSNFACTSATISTIVDPGNNAVGWLSLASGSDGRPVISYYDTVLNALKVARCNNASCTSGAAINIVDNPADSVGSPSSIAIGGDGWPVISYRNATAGTLKVAKCSNSSCSGSVTVSTVDNPANTVGASNSIVVGSDDRPVISYRDETAGALKVAKCANPACSGSATITTVDNPGNSVGFSTTVKFAADGLPIISYHDDTGGSLKVAKCANASCTGSATISVVDNIGDVGQEASMAIGTDGRPVIVYLDASESTLKVARCGNANCIGIPTIAIIGESTFGFQSPAIDIGSDGLPLIAYGVGFVAGFYKVAKCGSRGCR